MKRNINLTIILIFFCVAACSLNQADKSKSFLEVQYKALATSQEIYNAAWGSFKQHYDSGAKNNDGSLIINKDTYEAGLDLANSYYDAWMLWMDSVIAYERFKTPENIAVIDRNYGIFKEISASFLSLVRRYIQ